MSNSRDIADSAATINFIDGVTSNVQTQLNTATTAIAANTAAIGDINPSASLEAVASGALANGDTVIINANGTVTAAGLVTTPVPVIGSQVEFEAGTTKYISSAYDTTSNKVIIAYQDSSDNNKVKAIVGTVASGAITFGTPATIQSNQGLFTSMAYDANANKVVVIYHYNSANNGLAQVGTISGTSISFGAECTFSLNEIGYNAICYDSSANKLVIAWHESTTIKVTVGTISGTSITFGAVATTVAPSLGSLGSFNISLAYDSNANKSLLCYRGTNQYGYAAVISVSGTTASIGTPVVFIAEAEPRFIRAVYDSSNNKTLILYRKNSNSYGAARVATISGTSVTFGTEVTFASESTFDIGASFDTTINKTIVAYNASASSTSKSLQATISGTSVTFSSTTTYLSADTDYNALVYDPDSERTIFAFDDKGDSRKGNSLLYSATTTATNLTTENYIGISDAAYANGATAKIQLASATDDAQSGLTAGQSYFVQENGSLALTPDTIPVFAGTAVSATKLLIGERNAYPNQAGNSSKFLTTNGTAASWAVPEGSQIWTFIDRYDVTSSANTHDFTGDFSSTYDEYWIKLIDWYHGTTGAVGSIDFQFYRNGSLKTSGLYNSNGISSTGGDGTTAQGRHKATQSAQFLTYGNLRSDPTDDSFNGNLFIYNANSDRISYNFTGGNFSDDTNVAQFASYNGYHNESGTKLTGIRIMDRQNTSTVTVNGRIEIYGGTKQS